MRKCGLTEAIVDGVISLIDSIGAVEPMEPPTTEEQTKQLVEAQDKIWTWYLEWSAISRVAIKDRRYLRKRGFLLNSPPTRRNSRWRISRTPGEEVEVARVAVCFSQ